MQFQTIFEINSTKKTTAFSVMKQKRDFHGKVISKTRAMNDEKIAKHQLEIKKSAAPTEKVESGDEMDIQVRVFCLHVLRNSWS